MGNWTRLIIVVMVVNPLSTELQKEEEVVAQLERLGIRYLSRLSKSSAQKDYRPAKLIADIVKQPSARVRSALISLFLTKPDYSAYVPEALKHANETEARTLKFFYTAAVFLQQKYRISSTSALPDAYSKELGIEGVDPDQKLISLGERHQQASGRSINWYGTYENAAKHLFRQWELEKLWNK